MQQTPISTVQDMHNKAVPVLCQQLTTQAWEEAQEKNDLALGIDDFAMKKGHTYKRHSQPQRTNDARVAAGTENWTIYAHMPVGIHDFSC